VRNGDNVAIIRRAVVKWEEVWILREGVRLWM
jgi:hypothetical protein